MNNQQLLNEGLTLLEQIEDGNKVVAGATAVAQRLHATPYLTATLIAQRHDTGDMQHSNLVQLFEKVDHHFNEGELRDLCFQLQANYEDLPGLGKRDRARELVTLMDRHGRLADLTDLAARLRPKVRWQDAPQQAEGAPIIARLNVAVVVDITRHAARDTARYLDEVAEMDVNFLLLQNARTDHFLDSAEKWDGYVAAFAQAMERIKHTVSGARLHFFLSAPGALIFGLGCIWGTVDNAEVYHYQNSTYYPVITISRALRR